MITAILPTMTATHEEKALVDIISVQGHPPNAPSISSEATITPHNQSLLAARKPSLQSSPTRSAGFVGLFSGCGALLALLVFLRLPDLLEGTGASAADALKDSYYAVGVLAFVLSAVCVFGLRGLHGEAEKGWSLFSTKVERQKIAHRGAKLLEAIKLGFEIPSLGLAYLGGE